MQSRKRVVDPNNKVYVIDIRQWRFELRNIFLNWSKKYHQTDLLNREFEILNDHRVSCNTLVELENQFFISHLLFFGMKYIQVKNRKVKHDTRYIDFFRLLTRFGLARTLTDFELDEESELTLLIEDVDYCISGLIDRYVMNIVAEMANPYSEWEIDIQGNLLILEYRGDYRIRYYNERVKDGTITE